jgi:hypothetical protein
MQKQMIGYWIWDFDAILLSNCKIKSIIWIFIWTHWATHWQPVQFRLVGTFPLNLTRNEGYRVQTTRTANVTMFRCLTCSQIQSNCPELLHTLCKPLCAHLSQNHLLFSAMSQRRRSPICGHCSGRSSRRIFWRYLGFWEGDTCHSSCMHGSIFNSPVLKSVISHLIHCQQSCEFVQYIIIC